MTPGWVHSFAVTEKYIIVPEMPLRYSVTGVLKSELTPWYIFDWVPESGSYMHVICRLTGKTVRINTFSIRRVPVLNNTFHYVFIPNDPDQHLFHVCSQCYNF
jgi:carotenoid cleavage dioxygenase-like enzyme